MKKEDRIWKDLNRFTGSIRDEIKSSDPDRVSIEFWLFKIERRIQILKQYIENNKK